MANLDVEGDDVLGTILNEINGASEYQLQEYETKPNLGNAVACRKGQANKVF